MAEEFAQGLSKGLEVKIQDLKAVVRNPHNDEKYHMAEEWHQGASQDGCLLQHKTIEKKNALGATAEATQAWCIPRQQKNPQGCKWSSKQPAQSCLEKEEFKGGPAGGSHPDRPHHRNPKHTQARMHTMRQFKPIGNAQLKLPI